jgi:hypothetical protein
VQEIKTEEGKRETMKLEGNTVEDTYTGKTTRPYVGKYKTSLPSQKCVFASYSEIKHCLEVWFDVP